MFMLKKTIDIALRTLVLIFILLSVSGRADGKERSFTVQFTQDETQINPSYRNNKAVLDSLAAYLRDLDRDLLWKVDSIKVVSYASPDGPTQMNDSIANLRGESVCRYIVSHMVAADSLVGYCNKGVAWQKLAAMVRNSRLADRDEIVRIVEMPIDRPYRRILLLEELNYGWTYQALRRSYFPKLRFAEIVVTCSEIREQRKITEPITLVDMPEDAGTRVAVEPVTVAVAERKPEKRISHVAFKTNVAALGAGVANLGAEFRLGRKMSFELPVMFSPYTIKADYKMRIFAVQPELRYWFEETFSRHFIGLHGNGAFFNVAFDKTDRYQNSYEHPLWGAGLSYGYFLKLGAHCGFEFTLGAGYAHIDYNIYHNVPNGEPYDSGSLDYWGLTKLGINFVCHF